jgi:DNA-3-methyladenine glycosylase II
MDTATWNLALETLRRADSTLGPLFDRLPGERIQTSGRPFQVLVNAIVGQQISVAAAAAIFGRLQTLLGEWVPEAVGRVSDEQLRQAGLSVRKVGYLRTLADAFLSGQVKPDRWPELTEEQVVSELVALKGIGRWTAEMVLIFQLQRPDILPLADIGLLKAAALEFGWPYPFEVQRLVDRAELWRPWRTVVVWHLWRTLDRETVIY